MESFSFFDAVFAAFVSVLVPAILIFASKMLKKLLTTKRTIKEAMLTLLQCQLVWTYNDYYEHKGYCPISAKNIIEDMLIQYEHLGGNGVMQELVAQIMTLPSEIKPSHPRDEAVTEIESTK